MKKKSHYKPGSVILVLLFLIGLFLVIWPVATELLSYKKDDAEYESMSTEFHLPESSPVSAPVPTVTCAPENPTKEPARGSSATASVSPTSTVMPTNQPTTEQPWQTTPINTLSPAPRQDPTVIPESTPSVTNIPTGTPTTPSPMTTEQQQSGIDLEACLKQNKDFIAWLAIPGTKIDYPVVRSNNTAYYLRHLFNGKESKLGCLFSLKSSDYQTPSKNIAIHGHHLSNSDAMFSTLLRYKEQSYCAKHSLIQLDSLYGTRTYRVFAVVNMNVSDWDASTASFSGSGAFLRFVNRAIKQSLYETGVKVNADDNILTLITCDRSYGGATGRLLVMAVELQ